MRFNHLSKLVFLLIICARFIVSNIGLIRFFLISNSTLNLNRTSHTLMHKRPILWFNEVQTSSKVTNLKGPIPSILVVHFTSFSLYNHMGCTLFWVKFRDAFDYFVVSVS